jgi:hypothetical protein
MSLFGYTGLRLSTFQVGSKTYLRPEPRLSTALRLAKNFSFKASYAYMNQYVHLLSNTGLGLITLSSTWVYGTGNAVTLPVSVFQGAEEYVYAKFNPSDASNDGFFNLPLTQYDGVNNFRGEAYHRLDLAIQLRKKKRRHERTWEFAIYSITTMSKSD